MFTLSFHYRFEKSSVPIVRNMSCDRYDICENEHGYKEIVLYKQLTSDKDGISIPVSKEEGKAYLCYVTNAAGKTIDKILPGNL